MELRDVLNQRRSCREFTEQEISDDLLHLVIEGALWAPSPVNRQPWEFVVIKSKAIKDQMFEHSTKMTGVLHELSGWGWLSKYSVEFLQQAPVLIAVAGDPKRNGADAFLEGRGEGYQHACAAAVQNMLLVATDLGLGSLWFTLFDKEVVREMLNVEQGKDIIAVVCLGYPAREQPRTGRKPVTEKMRVIE